MSVGSSMSAEAALSSEASPGPSAARSVQELPIHAPGLPYIGSTLGYLFHPLTYHLEAYRRFGPIYRTRYLQKMQVVIAGLEANEFVWRNSELWNYGATRAHFREQFNPNYLTQLDGEAHRKKRRQLNPAFRPDMLMARAPAMSRVCARRLADLPGGRGDLRRYFCHRLLLAMSSEALLNVRLPAALEDQFILTERALLLGGLFGSFRDRWFRRKSYQRDKAAVMAFLRQMVRERLQRGFQDSDYDLFSITMRTLRADEPPLSEEEMAGDLYVLFLGGLNSTASLCIWSLIEVYKDPAWLEELRAELDAVPPDQFQSMSQWPKMKATIMEIERLRPPTPAHTLLPTRDFELFGVRIPARTPIVHVQGIAHFLSELYPDPFTFNPRRFLDGGDFARSAHGAFGGGAHRCLGMPLARIQTPLLLANVVSRYDLKFEVEPSFKMRLEPSTMPRESRLPIILTPRR